MGGDEVASRRRRAAASSQPLMRHVATTSAAPTQEPERTQGLKPKWLRTHTHTHARERARPERSQQGVGCIAHACADFPTSADTGCCNKPLEGATAGRLTCSNLRDVSKDASPQYTHTHTHMLGVQSASGSGARPPDLNWNIACPFNQCPRRQNIRHQSSC